MNFYPDRGSMGYGQNCAQALMGEIGTRDVNDCVQGIEECLQNMPQSNRKEMATIVFQNCTHHNF